MNEEIEEEERERKRKEIRGKSKPVIEYEESEESKREGKSVE